LLNIILSIDCSVAMFSSIPFVIVKKFGLAALVFGTGISLLKRVRAVW
jgi:hypothetical protein